MKAMIIGAGRIGRGFITELLKPGLTNKTKPSAIVTFENGVNPAKLLQLTADDRFAQSGTLFQFDAETAQPAEAVRNRPHADRGMKKQQETSGLCGNSYHNDCDAWICRTGHLFSLLSYEKDKIHFFNAGE